MTMTRRQLLLRSGAVALGATTGGLLLADRGWSREKAAMLLSAAADVSVSQLVNARASVKVALASRYFSTVPFSTVPTTRNA